MIKKLSAGLFLFLFTCCAFGASQRISDLPATNAPAINSIMEVSAQTGAGGYTSRSITMSNLVRTVLLNSAAAAGPHFVLKISSDPFTNNAPTTLTGLTNSGSTLLSGVAYVSGAATFTGPFTNYSAASTLFSNITSLGQITVGRDPAAAMEVVTKQYADSTAGTGITNARILYVQTNGLALSQAVRGNPNKPYNSITAAVSQALSGDTIKLGAGKFYVVGAAVELPDNVSLVGEGMHATEIIGGAQLLADGLGPLVNPGDNSYVGHMSITSSNEANFAAPIGVTVVSAHSFTNVVVDSVRLFGNTDNVYVDTNELAEMTIFNSYLFGTFDNVFIDGFTNSIIHLHNCKIYGTNPVDLANNGQHVRNINVFNGRVKMDNCSLYAQGGTFWSANIYTADADARVWVNNTSFEGSTSGGFYSITNNAGNIWIQSCSIPTNQIRGSAVVWNDGTYSQSVTNSLRLNLLGLPTPIGPAGLTNVDLSYPRRYHTLMGNETLTLSSSTSTFWGVSIQLYTDGSERTVSWNTNQITADSAPWTNNFSFTGPTLLMVRVVTNHVHIDWSGTNAGGSADFSVTNGLASIDYANSLVGGVTAVSSNAWTETFGGTLANWEKEDSYASGFAISSGRLRLEHDGFGLTNCLRYTNWHTMSHGWTFEMDVTPLSTNASDSIGMGIRSYRPQSDRNLAFRLMFGIGQQGRITSLSGSSNLTEATKSETNLWCGTTIGDTYRVTMKRRGQDFSMFVSNKTDAAHPITKHTWSCTLTNGIRIEPFMGYPTIWGMSGTQEVDNVSFSVDFLYPVTFLCVGDSITTGIGSFSATTNDVRVRDAWPQQLRERMNNPTIQGYSCGSVGMYNIGLVDREIALFAPSNILCNFGVTDTGFGIDVYKSNYIRFDSNALVNILRGGKVYKLWPSPQDSVNLHEYWQFLMTNWPSENLDCVTFAKDEGNNYTLRERFDTGDGIHPNREFLGTFSGIVERFLRGQ